MMRFSLCSIGLLFVACTSGNGSNDAGSDATPGDGGVAPLTLSHPCADMIDAVYGDPGADLASKQKGQLIKCARDGAIGKDDLQAKAIADGYKGKPFTTGVHVYRISYRTERGDDKSTPAVSSAAVYVPDSPRASGLPVVMLARGSRGQAAKCAASRMDMAADAVNGDLRRLIYPIAGAGYAVIVSDLAGYANFGAAGNPPSAYASALDVAKSTLDSGRALKNLLPALGDKSVIVGHSQGGHSALASLALEGSYGTAGKIAAVATFAPLWISQRAWGAVAFASIGKNYPIDTNVPAAVSIWYNYTHAELLDGPGEGVKLFRPAAQPVIKQFVESRCWEGGPYPELSALGSNVADLYDPAFGNSVGLAAAVTGDCGTDPVCAKWLERYADDRPHITSKVPLLVLYGGNDTTIPPNRITCAIDRLRADGANMTFCYVPGESHGSVVAAKGDYVADWIASLTLAEPAPPACPMNETAIMDDGGPATCATPPPND